MFRSIDVGGVRRLLANGAQLVDVLPSKEFAADHLPGARNLSLTRLDGQTARQLDAARPVIVYCHDHQ